MTSSSFFDLVIVDAFTSHPFSGNPAAVCFLNQSDAVTDATLQLIAAEMNLSETAFVQPRNAAEGLYSLRWFTPTTEVQLCGHATLATAWALFTERADQVTVRRLRFATLSGELTVERDDANANVLRMEFPLGAPAPVALAPNSVDALRAALWPADSPSRQCTIDQIYFCTKTRKLMIEVAHQRDVVAVKPSAVDLVAVFPTGSAAATGNPDVRGVVVTTGNVEEGSDYRICSRNFSPWLGIAEDPVTGSAHTVLAAMFSERKGHTFRARQASQRNGIVHVSVDPAHVPANRVWLSGEACTVLRGKLDLTKYGK